MPNTIIHACYSLKNAERARKKEVIISSASKGFQQIFLRIFQRQAYIGEFERCLLQII